jgi:hypothetical protein
VGKTSIADLDGQSKMPRKSKSVNPPAAGARPSRRVRSDVAIEYIEMYSILFRIVRTWQQRAAVGHDLAMAARSIIRRVNPDEYAAMMKRWPDAKPSPLPAQPDKH